MKIKRVITCIIGLGGSKGRWKFREFSNFKFN